MFKIREERFPEHLPIIKWAHWFYCFNSCRNVTIYVTDNKALSFHLHRAKRRVKGREKWQCTDSASSYYLGSNLSTHSKLVYCTLISCSSSPFLMQLSVRLAAWMLALSRNTCSVISLRVFIPSTFSSSQCRLRWSTSRQGGKCSVGRGTTVNQIP